MSQQVISYADLSVINRALSTISSEIISINHGLGTLNHKQDLLENELQKLFYEFTQFVEADKMSKALQLAETRVGNLKQDLQIKFGYYAEVRRMATGILQGVDTGMISEDTLRFTTEEVMIKAPGYWLAPALIALASWIRNDPKNCDRAIQESLGRDDYKTTLFFMLIMRRLGRMDATFKWLERYFMHQNPHKLHREFIIILEAVTTGAFPPASRNLMMKHVRDWLGQLLQTDRFVDEQKAAWIKFFETAHPTLPDQYPALKKYATNYAELEGSLRAALTYNLMCHHFKDIFSSSQDLSKAVKLQLDEILSLLVTNFDDEELPLQKQVRLNQLIIQMDGDKVAAQAKMDAEEHVYDQHVDFLQLLTNAAFNPLQSGATKATVALAVSISQPWILEASDIYTARNRQQVPQFAEFSIDGFNTKTTDGSDEEELLQQQGDYYEQQRSFELQQLPSPATGIVIGALLAIAGCWLFFKVWPLGIIAIGIGAVIAWNAINKNRKARKVLNQKIDEKKLQAKEVLRGCIAELVDFQIERKKADANAEMLRELLLSITPEDFSAISKETARSIIIN